jgi:hypothetical protein
MKKLLTTIEEHKKLLSGVSLGVGILLGFLGAYGLAFLCIFPVLFFSVNSYLTSKADIPTYKPTSNAKKDKKEYNGPQDYSSYRAELFNSIRNKKKK